MSTTQIDDELEELSDETREHVLRLLKELERQLKARRDPGIVTKGTPPSGSAKKSIGELKDLFGDDELDHEDVDEDAEGWMNSRTRSTAADPDLEDVDEDAEGWI
jgi:hypothetical protein